MFEIRSQRNFLRITKYNEQVGLFCKENSGNAENEPGINKDDFLLDKSQIPVICFINRLRIYDINIDSLRNIQKTQIACFSLTQS